MQHKQHVAAAIQQRSHLSHRVVRLAVPSEYHEQRDGRHPGEQEPHSGERFRRHLQSIANQRIADRP